MATVARAVRCCQLQEAKQEALVKAPPAPTTALVRLKQQALAVVESDNTGKIMLQPRLCTLRSYGSDRSGIIMTRKDGPDEVSPFFETLSAYIESSKKSQDLEIIFGRLAMILFAATITTEAVTGNSLFRKLDVQGLAEAAGVCLGAVTCAAIFAYVSRARNRVGRIFSLGCNTLIDSLIDQIVDGLFYDTDLRDWSEEI